MGAKAHGRAGGRACRSRSAVAARLEVAADGADLAFRVDKEGMRRIDGEVDAAGVRLHVEIAEHVALVADQPGVRRHLHAAADLSELDQPCVSVDLHVAPDVARISDAAADLEHHAARDVAHLGTAAPRLSADVAPHAFDRDAAATAHRHHVADHVGDTDAPALTLDVDAALRAGNMHATAAREDAHATVHRYAHVVVDARAALTAPQTPACRLRHRWRSQHDAEPVLFHRLLDERRGFVRIGGLIAPDVYDRFDAHADAFVRLDAHRAGARFDEQHGFVAGLKLSVDCAGVLHPRRS